MRTHRVIPVQERFWRVKRVAVRVVRAEPSFDFPVGLRVLDACFDMLNLLCFEEGAETRFRVEKLTRELRAVIADHLLDHAMFHRFFQAANARGCRRPTTLDERKDFPARIVFDGVHPLSSLVKVPINMHCGERVSALVAHARRWPACFLRATRETKQEQYLMNAIMPELHVVISQDYARQRGRADAVLQPGFMHEGYFPLGEWFGRSPDTATDYWRLAKALVFTHDLVDTTDAHTPNFAGLVRCPPLVFSSDSLQKLPSCKFHTLSYLTEGK